MSTMGERLKEARLKRNYSQVRLASSVGVSRGVITNIEGGLIENPKQVYLEAICNELNINSAWLISGEGDSGLEKEGVMTKNAIKGMLNDFNESELYYILEVIKAYKNSRNVSRQHNQPFMT